MTEPTFTNDAIVFGILMLSLGLVFYTENKTSGFWHKFYKIVPGLFMAYFIPAIFTTLGIISPEWETINTAGKAMPGKSQLYYVASRFLLPAALVLMTLSIDLKAIFNLGSKNGLSKDLFLNKIAKELNLDTKNCKIKKINFLKNVAIRPKDMIMNCKKFEKTFKMRLPSLQNQILQICKAYKN